MRTVTAIITLACLTAAPVAAVADAGSPTAGLTVAKEQCADCHAIEKGAKAMPPIPVPTFDQIAASEHNAQSLRVFLRTPHADMPNIVLTDQQRDDIAAYIMSLRPSE